MKQTKNIGGSILPSSSAAILQPLKFNGGELVVVPLVERNTHALVFRRDGTESELASHPNGFSCRSLAERIIAGDAERIAAQLKYIIDCGGSGDDQKIQLASKTQ